MKFIMQNKTGLAVLSIFLIISNAVVPCMAAETITCYHGDVSGNIVAVTDDSGLVVSGYEYTPYGRTLAQEGPSDNAYKFSGLFGITEELPDLYFMRARYYSADAARFLSTDPIKNIGPGWKYIPYEYGVGNPLRFTDPDGNNPFNTVTSIIENWSSVYAGEMNSQEALHESVRDAWSIVPGMGEMIDLLEADINHEPHPIRKTAKKFIKSNSYGLIQNAWDIGGDIAKGQRLHANDYKPLPLRNDLNDQTIDDSELQNRFRHELGDIEIGSSLNKKLTAAVKAGEHAQYTNTATVTNAAKAESPKSISRTSKTSNSARSTASNIWKSVASGTKKAASKVKSWFKKWF
jgi:RHS repeat-associated protein